MAEGDYVVVQEAAKQMTMGGWRSVALADAPVEIIDGDRGKNYPKQDDFLSGGHCLFLNAGNVTADGFNFSTCAFISSDRDRQLGKGKLARHDVVLTTRGTVGNIGYFSESVPHEHVRINSGMVILRASEVCLHHHFLYFVTRSQYFHSQVQALSTGSAQPQLPIRDIKKINIPLPPLPEQRAIAHVLGTLDDKIELNRRMNETLEAMARALFKSWFVDFDPVRAKMEGRWRRGESLPGLPSNLYDLFPNRLVDSDLGEIPEGWGVGTVSQLAERIQNGGTPKRSDPTYWERRDIPWLTSGEVRQSFVLDTLNYISRRGFEHSSAKMIPARSILVALYGATAGQVSMNIRPLTTNQAVSAIIPSYGNRYFCLISLKLQVGELGNRAVGSAQQNLSKQAVESTNVVLPPIELRLNFDLMVERLFERISRNLQESRILSAQRDALLPELVSGEVRMGEPSSPLTTLSG